MSGDGPKSRQTLVEIAHGPNSLLPQPNSALKKLPKQQMYGTGLGQPPRMSLAPQRTLLRSSNGPDSMMSSSTNLPVRETMRNSSRQSYAPPLSQSNRRSSSYSVRQSSVMFGMSQVQNTAKDSRPIRDKQYQTNSVHKILDYLVSRGFSHPVTQKSLQTPTSKDFATIFKWLYNKIDPSYQFIRKIEDEVVACLRALQYPFVDCISKSQLNAVGSVQAWPIILAMLTWLTELNICAEKTQLNDENVEQDPNIWPERIFYEYIIKAYCAFLNGDDDFTEFEEDMERIFDQRNSHISSEVERLENELTGLVEQCEELENIGPALEALEKETLILQSDKEKFVQYIQHLEGKVVKLKDKNQQIMDDIPTQEDEIKCLKQEAASLQSQINAQAISSTDIDRMISDRESLCQNLKQISAKTQMLSVTLDNKENEALCQAKDIDHLVQKCNTLGYRIGILPNSGRYASGGSYELNFNLNGVTDYNVRPDQLINRNIRLEIRPVIQKLREEVVINFHNEQNQTLHLRELLEKVNDGIVDKKDELEILEAKVASTIEQFNEIRDNMVTEASISNAETERLDRELQQIRITAQNGMLQLEQRSQSVGIEYDQLVHISSVTKEDMYRDVCRKLDEVIKFKLYIQTGLEHLERSLENENGNIENLKLNQEELISFKVLEHFKTLV